MADSSGPKIIPGDKPFRLGMVISNKFVLLRLIGEGGMSAVYEAKDSLIGRNVALKLLHPQFATNAEVVRRFRREAEATARIRHPNVVMVLEMGQRSDGSFFLVQELLAGENLRAYLDARKRLSADEAIELLMPIIGALIAAHSHGIVHRDVKPENIVLASSVSGELTPKLVDFGIAKLHTLTGAKNLTEVGSLWGTAPYMSPEQASGIQMVDTRTDVWAVGVVLFELISGGCPFDGPSAQLILTKILTQRAPRLDALAQDVPPELSDIVQRALEPDLDKRFPSMRAFRDELVVFASGRRRPPSVLTTGQVSSDDALRVPQPQDERGEARRDLSAAPSDLAFASSDTLPASEEQAPSWGPGTPKYRSRRANGSSSERTASTSRTGARASWRASATMIGCCSWQTSGWETTTDNAPWRRHRGEHPWGSSEPPGYPSIFASSSSEISKSAYTFCTSS